MMKNNLPRFLLATNEAALPGAAFIIQTRKPLVIASVLTFNTHEQAEEAQKLIPMGGKPYGYPVIIAYIGLLSTYDWPGLSDQEIADKIAGIMRRMSDWYLHNYLKK